MKWLLKSGVQAVFARTPGGLNLNRLFQGDIASGQIPLKRKSLSWMNSVLPGVKVALEVGTGWVPAIPLGLTAKGIRVHTYDRTRYATRKAIDMAQAGMGGDWSMVEYHAPADAAKTELSDASIDLHFSFSVFEHLPLDTMRDILREALRVLRPGAIAFHCIDCSDRFSGFDSSITTVNFLKFSESAWRVLAQNRIHYHNRLRASDHVSIFQESGFEIVEAKTEVDDRAVAALETMRLDPRFHRYARNDLATSLLILTARKP